MNIDVFDFDKTIYNGDSTIDFYLFCFKKNISIIKYLPIQIIAFILYKIKLRSKLFFKEKFFSFLNALDNVDELVERFWENNKDKIKIDILNKATNTIVVISASPYFLLKPIIEYFDINMLIASEVDKNNGKFLSNNCYGNEKVKRLNNKIKEYNIISFYSDSKSDIYLAKLAKNSYLVNGNKVSKWL